MIRPACVRTDPDDAPISDHISAIAERCRRLGVPSSNLSPRSRPEQAQEAGQCMHTPASWALSTTCRWSGLGRPGARSEAIQRERRSQPSPTARERTTATCGPPQHTGDSECMMFPRCSFAVRSYALLARPSGEDPSGGQSRARGSACPAFPARPGSRPCDERAFSTRCASDFNKQLSELGLEARLSIVRHGPRTAHAPSPWSRDSQLHTECSIQSRRFGSAGSPREASLSHSPATKASGGHTPHTYPPADLPHIRLPAAGSRLHRRVAIVPTSCPVRSGPRLASQQASSSKLRGSELQSSSFLTACRVSGREAVNV